MNLVQINEHLKDVSIPVLMGYANGTNPIVPAYMATGELKRREVMQQKQQQMAQAQQGLPTVKDQVEQQAGLMALQAQQQKQAQDQMMQQAQSQPMPVPPETPQPQMQPEEESEYAYGGIARLPVRSDMYEFNSGGIIAFDGRSGSQVPPVVEETEEEKMRRIQKLLTQGLPSTQGVAPPPMEPLPQQTITTEPTPKPKSPLELNQDTIQSLLTPISLEKIAESQKEARRLAGVTGKYGEDQAKRLTEEDGQYQKMLEDRAFNRLLAVLSGIGRGGLGGAAPAYLQTQASEQAADIAQKRRMNEQRANIEAKQREEALAEAKDLSNVYGSSVTQARDFATRLQTEAINNQNAKDRADLLYRREVEMAKARNASELELQKLREEHDLKLEEIRRKNQVALENFRRTAPTDEQRNFESYLARWKNVPANKNKPETDAFTQYFSDRLGGQFKSEKADITGLNQLLVSYQKQLDEDYNLSKEEKARIRAAIVKTQNDLAAAIGRTGLPSLTGGDIDTNNPLLKK